MIATFIVFKLIIKEIYKVVKSRLSAINSLMRVIALDKLARIIVLNSFLMNKMG